MRGQPHFRGSEGQHHPGPGHGDGGPGSLPDPSQYGGEDPHDLGRPEGREDPVFRRDQDQRDLVFSATQAILAARAGATYVFPFPGAAGRHFH